MITFEEYRRAYLDNSPGASDAQIARAYMEFVGPPQFLDELGRGAARGAGQVVEGIGAAVRILSGDLAGEGAVELGEALIERYPRHPELAGSIIENPSLLADPSWWAGGVGELAPFLVPQAGVAGGVLKAGLSGRAAIGAASVTGGVLEGAPTFNRMMDQGDSYGSAAMKAGANIAGISALNLLPLSRAFGYGPKRGVLNRVMTTALGEGVTEVAEEPLGAFIEGNDPVQALYEGANVFPVAALTGGLLGGAGTASQPAPKLPPGAQIPKQITTPLSQALDILEFPEQFDESGTPVPKPQTGWVQNEAGDLEFQSDPKLLVDKLDFTTDLTLASVIDDPVLFAAYPQLARTPIGKLPKGTKGMATRGVPGRIEVSPRAKGDALWGIMASQIERQVGYIEGLVLPGKPTQLTDDQQAKVDSGIETATKEFGLDQDENLKALIREHATNAIEPYTPVSINDITESQQRVELKLSPKQARLLANSRSIKAPLEQSKVPAVRATDSEAQTETAEEPNVETSADKPATGPPSGAQLPPSSADVSPAMSSPGLAPAVGDRPPTGGEPPSGEPPGDGTIPPGDGTGPPQSGGTGPPLSVDEDYRIGNIQAGRINTDADAIEAFETLHDFNEELIMAQRRGVRTHDQTFEAARKEWARQHGMSYKEFLDSPMGKAVNAEELAAGHAILADTWMRSKTSVERFNEAPTDLNKAKAYIDADIFLQAIRALSGQIAEAGRTLNILRQSGLNQDTVKRILQDHPDAQSLFDAMSSTKDIGEAVIVRKKFEKAKASDILLEVWLAGLLSGPTTHVVNGLSNALVAALANAEVWVALGIGKLTGSDAITLQDAIAYTTGTLTGMVQGFRSAKLAYQTENDIFNASRLDQLRFKAVNAERMGIKKNAALVDTVGRGIRVPFRLLMASDAFFKTSAYQAKLNQLATHRVLSAKGTKHLRGAELEHAVEDILKNPSAQLKNKAIHHANYLTFTNPVGVIAGGIKRATAAHPVFKIIFPFVQTPANIIKFAFQRIPVADLIMAKEREAFMKKGSEEQQMLFARWSMGGSAMALTAYLAAEGLITGAPPSDPRERRLWYARGLQPYSVKVGDKWVAYGRLEPMGIILGMTADYVHLQDAISAYGVENEAEGWIQGVIGSMARNMLSKTYLKGLSDLILAIVDTERYGDQYIQGQAGTIVPTGIAQLQRSMDPYLRYSVSSMDRIKSRIPGLSEELPRRVDVFGRDIRLSPEGQPALVNLFNPMYIRQYDNDPVAKELYRLNVMISPLLKRIGEYKLTPVEYTNYQRIVGRLVHRQMGSVVRSPMFRALPDIHKRDRLVDVRKDAMKLGREIFMLRNPHIMIRSGILLAAEREGFEPRDLLIE